MTILNFILTSKYLMPQFLIRPLIISALFVLCSGCSSGITQGLTSQIPSENIIQNSFFSDVQRDYIYKASLTFKNHSFGGILIIKKLDEAYHRIVFTSEFGTKFFDFEFNEEQTKINFIMDQLDRKAVLKLLVADLSTLVREELRVVKQYYGSEMRYYETIWDGKTHYYLFSDPENELTEIITARWDRPRVRMVFEELEGEIAKTIEIIHKDVDLGIDLKLLE